MAAYLVLMQHVQDIDRYRAEYLPGLRPFLKKYGAEVLVAGFDAEPAEGEPTRGSTETPPQSMLATTVDLTERRS